MSEKFFEKLHGNRVYLELPQEDKSKKIIVDENTKDALNQALLQKLSRVRVFAVGDVVTNVQEGDIVLVDPSVLSKAYVVPLSDDVKVALVNSYDIIHTWEHGPK